MDGAYRINDDTAMPMPRISRTVMLVAAATFVACGGAQPQPTTSEPSEAAPPGPAEAEEPALPASPDAEEPAATPAAPKEPYGNVVEILPGKDDPADRRARVEIFNPTDTTCRFKSYTLRWGDSSKTMPLSNVEVAAGNSRQRFLIVHPNDGDVESLSAEGASLEVDVDCGP